MVKRNTSSSLMFDSIANGHQTTKPVMYVNNRRSIRLNDLEAGDSSKTWLGHMRRWTAISVIRTGRVYSKRESSSVLFSWKFRTAISPKAATGGRVGTINDVWVGWWSGQRKHTNLRWRHKFCWIFLANRGGKRLFTPWCFQNVGRLISISEYEDREKSI